MALHDEFDLRVPHHKGQVGVGALVAHQPVAVGEDAVQHAGDAFDFRRVAGLGRWELFGVEEGEPGWGGGR